MDRLPNIVKKFKNLEKQVIFENESDNTCFAQDAAYSDSKDLAKRTISDKYLKDVASEIAINPKYEDIKED